MERPNRKLQHIEEWYQNHFRTFHSSENQYNLQMSECEQWVSGDPYAYYQYPGANPSFFRGSYGDFTGKFINPTNGGWNYLDPSPTNAHSQVPFAYHFGGNYHGSYFVQLGNGSVVLVSATETSPTHRDQPTMSTRFKKKRKKRGNLGSCRGRLGKHRKHHGGIGNADEMKHHRILFDKYHLGYFGEVSTLYLHKGRNLSERERAGTSSLENDMAHEAIPEEGEEDFVVYDECPLMKIKEKKEGNNEDQLLDKIPQQDEARGDGFGSVRRNEKDNYVKMGSLDYDGLTDHVFEECPQRARQNCQEVLIPKADVEMFDESPKRNDLNFTNEFFNKESILLPFSCQYHLEPTETGKFNRNNDFLEDTALVDNFGVVPLESDGGSSIFYGMEDYLAADVHYDFGDNEVVVEDDKKEVEVKKVNLKKSEILFSLWQIVEGLTRSSLKENGLYLIEYRDEFLAIKLEPYVVEGRINEFTQSQPKYVNSNIWVQSFKHHQGVNSLALEFEHEFQILKIAQIKGILKSEIIQKDLTYAPVLSELGPLIVFPSSLVSGVLPSAKALTYVPDGLGAICLNMTGLEGIMENLALYLLVHIFNNQKYMVAMNEDIVPLSNVIKELLHQISSIKGTEIDLKTQTNNIASWGDGEYVKLSGNSTGNVEPGIILHIFSSELYMVKHMLEANRVYSIEFAFTATTLLCLILVAIVYGMNMQKDAGLLRESGELQVNALVVFFSLVLSKNTIHLYFEAWVTYSFLLLCLRWEVGSRYVILKLSRQERNGVGYHVAISKH